jgi:type II secretory pathway pseudopilin PulG
VLVATVVIGVALAGGIRESKQERAAAERRERAELRERRIRELEATQRPRLGRFESVAPAGAGPSGSWWRAPDSAGRL